MRPSSQVVLLLGDGAAGFSLMDVDSLVRHRLPVVMIVGNNGIWGLEKHPMQAIYGWDMACDLQPETRYDEVVRALGGAGETVRKPDEVGPALDRAFAAGRPLPRQRAHRPRRRLPAHLQSRLTQRRLARTIVHGSGDLVSVTANVLPTNRLKPQRVQWLTWPGVLPKSRR